VPISARAALKRDGGKKDASTWTITELAHLEKVAMKTVQMWIKTGKLKASARKDEDGIWRINKAKFKRPPGLAEQMKLNAAARKKEMVAKKPGLMTLTDPNPSKKLVAAANKSAKKKPASPAKAKAPAKKKAAKKAVKKKAAVKQS